MEQNEVQFLVILFSVVFLILLTMIISLVTYFQKKKVQYILDQERVKSQYEEQLLLSRIEISEQHMKNMSWELHDNIGQLLSVASMQIKMMKLNSNANQAEISEISNVISTSLDQVRSLSKSLNPEMVQSLGLRDSVINEFGRLSRLGLLVTEIDFPERTQFSRNQEILIFRIIQEAIANVLKHSEADLLSIKVVERLDNDIIIIEDDGCGFLEKNIEKSTGMANMMSRANLLNGTLKIDSISNQGTKITLEIPHEMEITHEET